MLNRYRVEGHVWVFLPLLTFLNLRRTRIARLKSSKKIRCKVVDPSWELYDFSRPSCKWYFGGKPCQNDNGFHLGELVFSKVNIDQWLVVGDVFSLGWKRLE